MTFDEQYGTDTEGFIGMDVDLGITSPNKDYATGYEPTPVEVWQEMIQQIPSTGMEQFTFCDLGAGKGRVLMLARACKFGYVEGTEFSPVLRTIAEENLGHVKMNGVTLLDHDCVDLDFVDHPLVIYMYNPFERPVTAIVMAHLEMSLHRTPRPAYLMCYKPTQRELIEQVTHFRPTKDTDDYSISQWRE